MNRALDQSRRSSTTAPMRAPNQGTMPSADGVRSPTIDAPKDELRYGHPSLHSPITAARPTPPDSPPPLECAYSRPPGSLSSHSEQSSPESSPYTSSHPSLYPPSRVSHAYHEATYAPGHDRKTPHSPLGLASQWELRSRSGPRSPDYEDMPSPTGSLVNSYTDTDDAPSPASSASSHQHSFSQHGGSHYEYYGAQSNLQSAPTSSFTSAKQQYSKSVLESMRIILLTAGNVPAAVGPPRQAAPHLYHSQSYSSSNPVSPVTSQPPSPTYATSPSNTYDRNYGSGGRQTNGAFVNRDTSVVQPGYSSSSLAMAGCSPTQAQPSRSLHGNMHDISSQSQGLPASHVLHRHTSQSYGHAVSSPDKYTSTTMLAPIQVGNERSVRNDNALRRAMSYPPGEQVSSHPPAVAHDSRMHPRDEYDVDGDSPAQELATPYEHMQQSHTQQPHAGNAHTQYGYPYSALPADHHNAWRADQLRPRTTLVH